MADLSSVASWPAISTLGLGLVFGLKHAIEADHLAAVATIVSNRKSVLSSLLVGVLWGVGHTISLVLAGIAVIFLQLRITERVALSLELGVAIMLIGLGAHALLALWRGDRLHIHPHDHAGHPHVHPHVHPHMDSHSHGAKHAPVPRRSILIGLLHGLAGSAALMLLVLTTIPSPLLGIAYITVFGLGSIGGMALMSLLVALPMQFTAARFEGAHLALRALACAASLGCGFFLACRIAFVAGLAL